MTSDRANHPRTKPGADPDWRLVLRLLAVALAMSALMSGTVLWILRQPVGRQPGS
jgi:hypothetical protein